MGTQELSVSWKDHSNVLIAVFEKLFSNRSLVDCTVAAEGHYLRVHKVVLSACSPYFEVLLNEDTDKHPIIILRDVKFNTLKRIIDFAYRGEVKLPEDQLVEFLNVAESLQIKGLDGRSNDVSGKRLSPGDDLNYEPNSQISHKRLRNEYCNSKSIANEPIPSTESSTSEQSWCPPPIPSVPTDVNESSSIVYNESVQTNFSSSENKSSKGNSIVKPVHLSSKTIVKQEFVESDCFVPKEELGNEILEEEFTKDSFELEPEDQSVQPSTSQQYSQLPSTNPSSTNIVGHCALTGAKEPEPGGRKGSAVTSDEARTDMSHQTGAEILHLRSFCSSPLLHAASITRLPKNTTGAHRRVVDSAFLQSRPSQTPDVNHYTCDICHCLFSQRISLQRHMRVHLGTKCFQCKMCLRMFGQLAHLNRHMLIHTGEKPYKCDVCTRKFRDSKTLKDHERIHSGEKPYRCAICFKSFRQTTHLKVHMRVHNGTRP